MAPIATIEGIGTADAERLQEAGVRTTNRLIKVAGSKVGREELAEATDLRENKIANWVTRADLMRVRGVGDGYGNLLELAGVDSPSELAQQDPDDLYDRIIEEIGKGGIVGRPPSLSEVRRWRDHAGTLDEVVTY